MDNPQLNGVQFPYDGSGRRSTAPTHHRVLEAAWQPVRPGGGGAVAQEPDWRRGYPQHLRALLEAQVAAPERVVASCSAGLDETWRRMPYLRAGIEQPLAEAMLQPAEALGTLTLQGRGDAAVAPWFVPLKGQPLAGDALARQIDRWERLGICEPSHAQALRACLAHPEWFDLSDRHIVLLGAASEAGPLAWLMRWRTHVVAVDLPRPAVQRRIARLLKEGNARVTLPVAGLAAGDVAELEHAGADLLTQTPEIATWLAAMGLPLDIGSIAYLDGERHVRVTLAMDAITAMQCRHDRRTSLGYLATPTDLYAVPEDLAVAVMQRYEGRGLLRRVAQGVVRAGSRGRSFQPHVEGLVEAGAAGRRGVVDALVVEQGPNYAIAKRLQQWRAIVARAAGHAVSVHVAPSTTTASVVKNPLLAAGFRGARAFGCEVFEPATTHAIMAAMWVHDLRNPAAVARPEVPLAHPLDLICAAANHGGLWRVPYLPRSVLPMAAMLGMVKRR